MGVHIWGMHLGGCPATVRWFSNPSRGPGARPGGSSLPRAAADVEGGAGSGGRGARRLLGLSGLQEAMNGGDRTESDWQGLVSEVSPGRLRAPGPARLGRAPQLQGGPSSAGRAGLGSAGNPFSLHPLLSPPIASPFPGIGLAAGHWVWPELEGPARGSGEEEEVPSPTCCKLGEPEDWTSRIEAEKGVPG